ncbi:ImmA/IrrE family metallo-endopeptidase [Clostridium tyrobutyricum]|uniref:ImmA/IrrE family metallo-endopeptidase n=1 Tax=Clostridium tyrobutyricum TaxID=1519 RepID=UPI002012B2A5|nr:ImmA/IrrE family metallo-endopeptidase [Clostridium tyrobutyricum]MBR9648691.1 ImmA/IrrE family metallo-endopeptidase [Clostridium tyrobutyricum]
MEWIDNIIAGLLETYETNDPYELCDYLRIKIIKLEPNNILLRDKDAFYCRDLENNEVIFIKNNLDKILEKFILLHELGHALCNPDLLSAAFTFCNKGKTEKQANYFALKLSGVKFDETELQGMTLKQISAYTGIPYKALMQLFLD